MRSICNGNQLPFTPAASPSARSSVSPSVQAPSTDDASQELSTFSRSPESPSAAAEVPCNSAASEISHEDPEIDMASEGPGVDFGTLYYRRLLQGRGILYSDQQLTAGDETGIWVKAFASDVNLFRHDFTMTMMKLSTLGVLTSSAGQVRVNCSKVA